jgi:GntR family transcriptional regulator/MocR family aminotransferase
MSRFSPQAAIRLDSTSTEPIYRQLYQRIRDAIGTGLLKPGERVPAVRALALELGLSRGTVDAAFALLIAEGYVETRGQAGSVVAHGLETLPADPPPAPADAPAANAQPPGLAEAPALPCSPWLIKASAWAESAGAADAPQPFRMGLPALDAFPRKTWARLAARAARATQPADMVPPPVAGALPLRMAIAAHLHVARGIRCAPEQVFITAGYRDTLELVVRALLQPGDTVWTEQPGYPPARDLLRGAGMRIAPVPVDSDGMQVRHGIETAPQARAAIVTPAHHSPLSMALALPRRLALLDWAAQAQAWIIEDDYDGEYRYASRPLPALQSLDQHGRVLYAGTFSKVLFPAIRLAYLVVPPAQVARFAQASLVFSSGSPMLTQAIVRDFILEGHYARHIQRMRRLYAERRALAVRGLTNVLGTHLTLDAQPGGMHLILRTPPGVDDSVLAARLRGQGMAPDALSEWYDGPAGAAALLLGFTNIASADQAEALAQRIRALL